jgi:hypothetical protein
MAESLPCGRAASLISYKLSPTRAGKVRNLAPPTLQLMQDASDYEYEAIDNPFSYLGNGFTQLEARGGDTSWYLEVGFALALLLLRSRPVQNSTLDGPLWGASDVFGEKPMDQKA